MNNDLISREALKETIQALIEYDNAEEFDKGYNIALQGVIEKIDNASTVDCIEFNRAKELIKQAYQKGKDIRPQGEWVGNSFDEHHCNRCGHSALWEEEPDGYYEVQSNFCSNCGADMRGSKK